MRIKATAKEGQPEEMAKQMELALNERRVGVHLFQKRTDPTKVVAELVRAHLFLRVFSCERVCL